MIWFKQRRRRKLRDTPLTAGQRKIVDRNVPFVRVLNEEDRRELEGHMQVFLAEKYFEGCAGLEMTEEIRTTIAAQACLLLLHRETEYYPTLKSILVYPDKYVTNMPQRQTDGTVKEGSQTRLGESWHRGAVVLSWDDVRKGAADMRDGHNVVLHEFAHQLDSESGGVDGAPRLERKSNYSTWARVLSAEYEQLQRDLASHRRTFINSYGAQSPAEFFAVVTEAFFEQPIELRREHFALYEQLRRFYKLDPAELFAAKN